MDKDEAKISDLINGMPEVQFDINYDPIDLPCYMCGKESTIIHFPYGKTGPRFLYCDEHKPSRYS